MHPRGRGQPGSTETNKNNRKLQFVEKQINSLETFVDISTVAIKMKHT